MINNNVKKQYPVIRMPNGHPISATMYNRGDLHGVVYSNDIEFDDVLLSNVITTSTIVANLNVSTTVSSNILSSGLLLGTVTVSKLVNSAISTTSNITADVKLVYNLLSSLTTSSSVVGNLTIPKLVSTSLVSTGTIVADLSVSSATSSLLLDIYPNAAAAYSLRKLRTAYTGSAIRVRASTSGAEGDVSFDVNSTISASSTVTVTAVGTSGLSIGQQVTFSTFWNAGGTNQNVFVTTWYDQSGNARNVTQTTQSSQPQIVKIGSVILLNNKPNIEFNGKILIANSFNINNFSIFSVINMSAIQTYGGIIRNVTSSGSSFAILSANDNTWQSIALRYNNSVDVIRKMRSIRKNLPTNQYLENWISTDLNQILYENNNLTTTITGYANYLGNNFLTIGSFTYAGSIGVNGKIDIQEIILYDADQSTNQSAINTNINTHYAIY